MPYGEISDLLITLERHGLGELAIKTFPPAIERKLKLASATYEVKEVVEGLELDYDFNADDAKAFEITYKCISALGPADQNVQRAPRRSTWFCPWTPLTPSTIFRFIENILPKR